MKSLAVGRRGGKSRAVAVLITYLATLIDYKDVLVTGERGLAAKMLILRHPNWSVDDLLDELAALGFELPSRFLASEIRSRFKRLSFLVEAGVIDANARPQCLCTLI